MIEPAMVAVTAEAARRVAELLFKTRTNVQESRLEGKKDPEQGKKDAEEGKRELVTKLLASGIDPLIFDALLSNEIDRKLKTRFGIVFVVLTILFTTASHSIIVLNARLNLGISDLAMTGLIIETPIQFVGLLYIIARNLFPSASRPSTVATRKNKKPKLRVSERSRPADEEDLPHD